jgi:hypothetical protein
MSISIDADQGHDIIDIVSNDHSVNEAWHAPDQPSVTAPHQSTTSGAVDSQTQAVQLCERKAEIQGGTRKR